MCKLLLILVFFGMNMVQLYAETKPNYFPLSGDKPIPDDNPAVSVSNGPNLKFDAEGLQLGSGFAGPDIRIKDWTGAEGTVAFWIKPVTWDAETNPTLMLFRSLDEKDGAFLFYKYEGAKELWLYTAGEKGQSDVPLKYEGLKDWKKGDWHHVAFTWKRGSFAKMYIDGTLVCIKEGSFYFPKSFQGIRIAQGNVTSGWGVEGKTIICNLYVAAYPLTDNEIALFAKARPENRPPAKEKKKAVLGDGNVFPFSTVFKVPTLDGRIDTGEYPTEIPGLIDTEVHTLSPKEAVFCAASDHNNIYIAATIELPEGYNAKSAANVRGDPAQIAKGDFFFLFIRQDTAIDSKKFKGQYITIAPNGNIYDALEEIDWAQASCNRNTGKKLTIEQKSVIAGKKWTVELKIPRNELDLTVDNLFLFAGGFRLDGKAFALKDYPVWFDHYQAFSTGLFTQVGVKQQIANLNQGTVDSQFSLTNSGTTPVKGEVVELVAIPKIGEISSSMVMEKKIGQELTMTKTGVLHSWKRDFAISSSSAVMVKDCYQAEEPGLLLLSTAIVAEERMIFSRELPFIYFSAFTAELKPVVSKDMIKAKLSFYGIPQNRLASSVRIVFVSGDKVKFEQNYPVKRKEETWMIPMGTLDPGVYTVDISVSDQAGAVIAKRSLRFDKWKMPDWLHDRKGLEALSPDWVPAPWQPVKITDNELELWGRTYMFSKGGLLVGMCSQKIPLLAEGISVKFLAGGKEQTIDLSEPKLRKIGKGLAEVVQQGNFSGLRLESKQQIEFDGMQRFDLKIIPDKSVRLERLWIELPFCNIKYALSTDASSWSAGLVTDMTWVMPPTLWLGNDVSGCTYLAESCKGWLINSRKPRVSLQTRAGVTTLRLLIVNEPAELSSPLSFTFFLQATPVKPMFVNWRDVRMQGWAWTPPPTNIFATDSLLWASSYSKPEPRSWTVLQDLIAFSRKYHQKVYPYLTPTVVSSYDMLKRDTPFIAPGEQYPENAFTYNKKGSLKTEAYWYFAEDWNTSPVQVNSDGSGKETTEMVSCSPSSSWADYFCGSVYQILSKTDLDGFYFDLPLPVLNFDAAKGQVYCTTDGIQEGTFELLAMRNMYKRLYYIFDTLRGEKRKPYILGHGIATCTPVTAFWDVNFHGEEVKPSSRYGASRIYLQPAVTGSPLAAAPPPDTKLDYNAPVFRCMFGPALGLPVILLPQYGWITKLYTLEHCRELLSWTFLHNNLIWPAWIPSEPVYNFWNQVEIPFGMGDTVFNPYWNNDVIARPECIRVSYWKKQASNDYLVAVANWSDKAVEADIELPSSIAGFEKCLNMESGEFLKAGKRWRVAIPAYDLRIFRFGGRDGK